MPALNIIATQETVRNSGRSSSRPSGMRPYLLTANQMAKTTKALAARTKAQPPAAMTPLNTLVATALSDRLLTRPQTSSAKTRAAATPKTTLSVGKW